MIEDIINKELEAILADKPDDNTFICLTGDGKMLSVLLKNGLVFFYYPLGYPDNKTKHIVLSTHSKIIQDIEEDFVNLGALKKIFETKQLTYLKKK